MNKSTNFKLAIVIGLVMCLALFGQYRMERSSFSPGTAKAGGSYEMKEAAAGQNVSKITWYESGADSFYIWQGFVQLHSIPVIFSATACDTYPDPGFWNFVDLSATNPTHVRYKSYSNLSGGAWKTSVNDIYGDVTGTMDTLWMDEYSEWEYQLNSDASETPPYDYTRWQAKTSDSEFTDTVTFTEWLDTMSQTYFQQYRAQIDVVYEPSGTHGGIVDLVNWYQFGNDVSGTADGTNLDEFDDWLVVTGPQWADAGSHLEFPEHTTGGAEDWYTVNLRDWEKLDKDLDNQIIYGQPIPATMEASLVAWRGYVLMGVPLYPVEDTVDYRTQYTTRYGGEPPCWPPTTRADQDVVLYDDFFQTCETPDGGWPDKYDEWWQVSRFYPPYNAYMIYDGPCDPPMVSPFDPGLGYWLVQDHCDSVEIDVRGIKPNPNDWMEIPLAKWDTDPVHSGMFYNMCANPFYKDIGGGDVFDVLWHYSEIDRYNGGSLVETRTVENAVSAGWIDAAIQLWDGSGYFAVSCLVGEPNYGRAFRNWEGFWLKTNSTLPDPDNDSLVLRMSTTDGPGSRRSRPQPEPDLIASWKVKIGLFSEEAGQWDAHNIFGFKEYVDESDAQNRMFIEELPDVCYPEPVMRFYLVDESDTRYCQFYDGDRTTETIYNCVLDCRSVKDQKVAVRWQIENLPDGFTMFFEDPEHGGFVDMTELDEYTFISDGEIYKARVIVTAPLSWVAREVADVTDLPREFFLKGPTPNPFNAVCRIDFGIPETETGPVRIEVFDITGRKIRMLMDADLDAGYYDVTWQGVDNSGSEVASGNYFVRFTSPHRDETRKISLIK